jgi:hypothetical protein
MEPRDRDERQDRSANRHEPGERELGAPIEREHETYEGVFEEEEAAERERHAAGANDVY